jgi:hypothetical protein
MPCRAAAPARFSARRLFHGLVACAATSVIAVASPASAVTFQFRYDYDSNGFFGTAMSPTPARTALEFAGRAFSAFADTLAPIAPGGNDSWTAQFFNPSNPSTAHQESIANLFVPANTIIIYAGAGNLAASRVGEATRGFYSLPSNPEVLSPSFLSAIINRGEGSTTMDYAPWGGSISFDTTATDGSPRLWHFDVQTQPDSPAYDFLAVAMHELSHLMGFGFNASTSFQNKVLNGFFTGSVVTALQGGATELYTGGDHWADSVTSKPFVVDAPRPALNRFAFPGERNTLTPLDYAALDDIGWEVPPELLRLPGDADLDADVDGADWLLWQRGLGGFGGTPGDVNGDLRVDDYDGWMIQQYFGAIGSPPPSAAAPEPSGALLAALGVGSLRRRTR